MTSGAAGATSGGSGKVARTVAGLRRSSMAAGSAWARQHQWERLSQILPPEFDEAWATTSGIPGWLENRQAAALTLALDAVRPEPTVVEIGSYLGRSAVFMARLLDALGRGGTIHAVDPHTGDRQHLSHLGLAELPTWDLFRYFVSSLDEKGAIRPMRATSVDAAVGWTDEIDVLYIDGWHSYDAVVADGEAWLPHLRPDGVVIFDDYAHYGEIRAGVDHLAERGLFVPWGTNARQRIGGKQPAAPEPLATLLRIADSPVTGALHALRGRLGGPGDRG